MSSAVPSIACQRCGDINHTLIRCPYVKAVTFRPDGTVARAEFLTPADLTPTKPAEGTKVAADGEGYPRLGSKG